MFLSNFPPGAGFVFLLCVLAHFSSILTARAAVGPICPISTANKLVYALSITSLPTISAHGKPAHCFSKYDNIWINPKFLIHSSTVFPSLSLFHQTSTAQFHQQFFTPLQKLTSGFLLSELLNITPKHLFFFFFFFLDLQLSVIPQVCHDDIL